MPGALFHRIAAACAFAGLFAAGSARGETWVVDDDGPANFRDLPAAVAAAHDGDLLLLRPGRYGAVALVGKGLRIVGAGAGSVTIARTQGEGPFFEARELTTKQIVVLSGVTGIGRGATITIERCGGLVLLADLVVESRHPTRAGAGPSLSDCSNAVLARVAVLPGEQPTSGGSFGISLVRGNYSLSQVVAVGAPGVPGRSPRGRGGAGAVGLAVEDAMVWLARCEFVGGAGGPALWDERAPFCPEAATGGAGGPGLFVAGASELVAAGDGHEQMRGGDGGAAVKNPWDQCWSFAGDGGPGVRVREEDAERRIAFAGVVAQAGVAGSGDTARAGKPGIAVSGPDDAITSADDALPTLALDQPGVCGSPITLRVKGPPGGLVWLIVSTELGRAKLKGRKGFPFQALPGGYWGAYQLGRLDEQGDLLLSTTLPPDQNVVGRTFAVQALISSSRRGKRESFLTNVDVAVVADGSAPQRPTANR